MIEASKKTALDIKMMLPSCVPATPFENSGAKIDAKDMIKPLEEGQVHGVGEFMNFPGVIFTDDEVLDKLLVAKNANKIIDGHSPGLSGHSLNAYACTQIKTDHECETIKDMHDRISRGMYVMLRQGLACHDLKNMCK